MAEEIIFSEYQAEVFNEAEMMLRTQGYLGEQLFEDTYVLQKRLADWVIDAVPVNGSTSSLMSEATNAYNGVLGIATDEAPPPVIDNPAQSEPVKPDLPISVRPTLPAFQPTAIRTTPMRPVKPAIATPIAKPAPRPAVRPAVPTSIRRASTTKRNSGLFGGITNIGRNNGLFGGFGGFGGFGRR